MQFVGTILTDEIHQSEYRSSVIPCSVANSVGNKKNQTPMVLQTAKRAKFFFSRETFIDKIYPSVFSTVITDGMTVGDCGMGGKYFRTLCKLPTDIVRR